MRVKDTKDSTLMELIAQSEDRPMQLTVYNVKSQTTRGTSSPPSLHICICRSCGFHSMRQNLLLLCIHAELELTPSREWPGKGLLGVTIRFDSYEGAEDQLLHVLVGRSYR